MANKIQDQDNITVVTDANGQMMFKGYDAVPRFVRQGSQNALKQMNENQTGPALGASLFLLPAAIAAVVIANDYNSETSVCGQSDYTIDLKLFCYVAGYTQIGFTCIVLLLKVLEKFCSERATTFAALVKPKGFGGCTGLFYLVWAAIGMAMYSNQMSDACQDEEIAKVILAWSVIQYAFIGLGCCCLCCVFPCVAAGSMAGGLAGVLHGTEEETRGLM